LESAHTFWVNVKEQNFKKKKLDKEFDQNELMEIETIDTVQDFWMMYQHLRRPTAMPYGTFLHLFKKGIKPVWEDASLEKGCQLEFKT